LITACACKRALNLLETDYLRLRYLVARIITVIEFGVNAGGGNGANCGGIKVRTDTTELSDMVIARFGEGRNLVGKR